LTNFHTNLFPTRFKMYGSQTVIRFIMFNYL